MSSGATKDSITDKFQHLVTVLSSQRFLNKEGLGNEVPFFICDYHPSQAVKMERLNKQLINTLSQSGIIVLNINLYDLSIKLLQDRGVWDQLLGTEKEVSKNQLKELLQGILDPENHLVPTIAKKMQETDFDILFLTGIGEVFPYIRSHNILNNLQSAAESKPTVIFFPGSYQHSLETGASLVLFGKLQDDKYYRAFKISDYEI